MRKLSRAKKRIFTVVMTMLAFTFLFAVSALANPTATLTLPTIDLSTIMTQVLDWVTAQVVSILPIGVMLIIVLSLGRIIRRVVGGFGI